MDTRPPTPAPADTDPQPTQVIPAVPAAQETEPASGPDHWGPGPALPPRGVAVGVPGPDSTFLNPAQADFSKWAADWLADTAPAVQAKAEQYGSNSLAAMGHLAARMQGRKVPEIEALEAGCAVYAFGKMERVMDALLRGELPGRDSWNDLAVYSLMVLYMRQFGRWP